MRVAMKTTTTTRTACEPAAATLGRLLLGCPPAVSSCSVLVFADCGARGLKRLNKTWWLFGVTARSEGEGREGETYAAAPNERSRVCPCEHAAA